jgi:hypothetical protein
MSQRTGWREHKFDFDGVCHLCGIAEARNEDNPRPCPGRRPLPNLGAPDEARVGISRKPGPRRIGRIKHPFCEVLAAGVRRRAALDWIRVG